MADIAGLSVKLGLSTVEWNEKTDQAVRQAKKLQSSFNELGGGVQKLAQYWQQFGSVIGAVGMGELIRQTIAFTDEISDLAKGFDLTIGQTLAFRDALIGAGVRAEGASKIMSTLFSKIDEARSGNDKMVAQFEKLGLTFADLKSMSPWEAINKIAQGFENVNDKFEKIKLIKELLGKGGIGASIEELSRALEEGTARFDPYAEKIKQVGDISDKLTRNFENLKIAVADLLGDTGIGAGVIEIETFSNILKGLAAGAITLGVLSIARAFTVLAIELRAAIVAGSAFNLIAAPTNPIGIAIRLLAAGAAAIVFFAGSAESLEKGKQFAEGKLVRLPEQGTGSDGKPDSTKPTSTEVNPEVLAKRAAAALSKKLLDIDRDRIKIKADFINADYVENQVALAQLDTKEKLAQLDAKRLQDITAAKDQTNDFKNAINAGAATEKKRIEENGKATIDLIRAKSKFNDEERLANMRLLELDNQRIAYQGELNGLSQRQKDFALERFDLERKISDYKREELKKNPMNAANIQKESDVMRAAGENAIILKQQNEEAQRSFESGWQNAYASFMDNATNAALVAESMFTSVTGNISSAIDNFVRTGKLSFKDFAQSVIQDLIAIQLKAQAMQLLGIAFKSFGFTLPSATPMPKASGGEVLGGSPYYVGERGPELFVPDRGGSIIPNHSLSGVMGGGQTVNYNGPYIANMSAIDTQTGMQFLAKNKQTIWAANQSAQRSLPMSK
jgi:lambda family phage tail tape measure protein